MRSMMRGSTSLTTTHEATFSMVAKMLKKRGHGALLLDMRVPLEAQSVSLTFIQWQSVTSASQKTSNDGRVEDSSLG